MRGFLPFVLVCALQGATSTVWELNGFQDFLRGKLSGVAVTRDGRLTLAPRTITLFSSEQPEIWSIARDSGGSLYLGTGHRGRVYQVDSQGNGTLLWTADRPEIFALAGGPPGVVYAASSPEGKVYRIEGGTATEYFAPPARYIWALALAKDGSLFVGTGEPGRVYQVTPDGQAALYFDSEQAHITCLTFDTHNQLLAGSEPNGLIYRLSQKKAFVLYHSALPEIRVLRAAPDGSIYASAMGGSILKRLNSSGSNSSNSNLIVSAPATSITVTENAQSGVELKQKPDTKPQPSTAPANPATAAVVPVIEYAGVERSAIYKISQDNTVETLWTSKDENIYDIALVDKTIWFSTDAMGRIYRLTQDRRAALILQTEESETTRLLNVPGGILATTGNMGKLLRLEDKVGENGSYESPVHDAGAVARWGHLSWHAETPGTSKIRFQTRSGNSARPDVTWSTWSEFEGGGRSIRITSPNARYVQWRAELSSSAGTSPSFDSVSLAYLPQNTPPVIRSISVNAQAAPLNAAGIKSTQASGSIQPSYSITVTESGEAPPPAGTTVQALSRPAGQQTQIIWQADDPDGDRLVYSVFFRGEDEREWKLLRENIFENLVAIDSDALADGRYYFRVVASDRPSNAAESARETDLVSAPVLIDNTPPLLTAGTPRRSGRDVDLDVEAVDQTSALRRCEYSVDAGPWIPVEAADGVTDSPREQFHLHLIDIRAGEHLIVVRAYDSANNAGLTKVIVR